MADYKGIGSALGLGIETVYGTPVSRTNWLKVSSITGRGVTKNYVDNPLLPDQATREQPVNVRSRFEASVKMPLHYNSFGLIWYYAMGLTPVTTGAGPFTHVYELDDAMPTSLTCEFKRGNATNAETGEGVKIDKLRISGSADSYIDAELTLIGENAAVAAVGTPAYATTRTYAAAWHTGDLSWNSGAYCMESFELSIERNHSEPTRMGCSREPVNDYAKVSGKFTVGYDGEAWYSGFTAETVADADFTLTSGSESIKFDLQNLVIKSVTRDVSDGGVIMQTIEFECYADASKAGLKVTNINAQANYNDN